MTAICSRVTGPSGSNVVGDVPATTLFWYAQRMAGLYQFAVRSVNGVGRDRRPWGRQTSYTPLRTQIPYLHPQKPFPSCTCCERNGFLFFAEGHMTGHGRSGSQCWLCR